MLCEKKTPSRCNAHTALKSRPARLRDFLAKSNCPKLIPTAELHPKTAAVRLCSVLALQHRFFYSMYLYLIFRLLWKTRCCERECICLSG